jgi:cysteine desulfurase
MYFDNNSNVPMTDAIMAAYRIGSKLGNISNGSPYAEIGQSRMNYLTDTLKDRFAADFVIYTSGGSESNSMALDFFVENGFRIISSTAEHSSIIEKIKNCGNVAWIAPEFTGHTPVAQILGAVGAGPTCVVFQSINSETGAIQNIGKLISSNLPRSAHIHMDHVQGFMKADDQARKLFASGRPASLAISFHKIGAPIGFGALLVNKAGMQNIRPIISGTQNGGMRGGTYNIAAIYATLRAMDDYDYSKIAKLRGEFDAQLAKEFLIIPYHEFAKMASESPGRQIGGDYIVVFSCNGCLPHTIFMCVGKDNKILCNQIVKNYLGQNGLIIGSGSACNSGKTDELGSMRSAKIPLAFKNGFLRISLSCYNTVGEVKKLAKFLGKLRNLAE